MDLQFEGVVWSKKKLPNVTTVCYCHYSYSVITATPVVKFAIGVTEEDANC